MMMAFFMLVFLANAHLRMGTDEDLAVSLLPDGSAAKLNQAKAKLGVVQEVVAGPGEIASPFATGGAAKRRAEYCSLKNKFEVKLEPSQKWKDCAIVSSSGDVRNHLYGAKIDEHETVIRINGAPSGGALNPEYVDLVGEKESVRIIAGRGDHFYKDEESVLQNISKYTNKPLMVVPVTANADIWKANILPNFLKKAPEDQFAFLTGGVGWHLISGLGRHIGEVYGKKEKTGATTGSVAVLIALSNCDKLTFFSFQPSAKVMDYHFDNREKLDGDAVNSEKNNAHTLLAEEHQFWFDLSGSDHSAIETGIMHMDGFESAECDNLILPARAEDQSVAKHAASPSNGPGGSQSMAPADVAMWNALDEADLWYEDRTHGRARDGVE